MSDFAESPGRGPLQVPEALELAQCISWLDSMEGA